MAYGQFTAYEPGPFPDSYRFSQQNGPPLVFTGPQAEALKQRLDASAQFAPVAVADNTPTVATALPASYQAESDDRVASALDATPLPIAASVAPSAPAPGSAPLDTEPNMSVAPQANAAPIAPPPGAPAPAGAGPAGIGARDAAIPLTYDPKTKSTIYLRPGGDRNNPADLFTMAPGSAPTKAGFAPSVMKISGGSNAISPNDIAALRENSIDQKLAYQTAYDLQAENFAEQRATLDAQAASNAIAAREAQQRQQAMQDKADQLQAHYDQAKQDYGSSGIDAGRYMRGNWLSSLGMALGSFGAALARTPNFAQEFVSQQIQNDIRSQEAAIKIKGDKQQTALGDLQRQLGSLDLAKTAYSGVMLQEAKRRLEVLANHQQTREAAANYVQGAAQLDALLQQNDVNFRKQAMGNVETEFRYHQGSAGSPGGPRPVTAEQFAGASHGAPKMHVSPKSQEQQFAVQDAKAAIIEAGAAVGLHWDPDKQEMVGDTKLMAGGDSLATEAKIKAKEILGANAGTIAEAAGERKPPVGQIHEWVNDKMPSGANTGEHFKQFLSSAMRNADRKGRHAAVQTTEPEPVEHEEPLE